MRRTFEQIDKNFDGKLTRDELLEGLKELDYENYEEEVERIMSIVDFDDNGSIEFTEWCTATMNKRTMLS